LGRKLPILVVAILCVALTTLAACGTVSRIRGKQGASNDAEATQVKPEDPLARPTQVAWTSARARHCGFMFDPVRLKSDYLASEARRYGLGSTGGTTDIQMKKLEKTYDYTFDSVTVTIQDDPAYCNKSRADAIRKDLNRYLAGDYTPSARAAR
jgi:hypothetical protein